MNINSSGRYELKYVLTREQYSSVVEDLAAYMQPDPHGDENGHYLVTSLYYDTPEYKAYWDKMEGLRFRRKLRVRVYGEGVVTPDTICSVEIKQRTNRTVQKKRVALSHSTAIALCGAGVGVNGMPGAGRAVIDEVQYLRSVLQLQAACIVSYDRQAFIGTERDPGLRVTFDTNMKGRTHDLSLLSQDYAENHFFVPPQWYIMEIKADGHVPYWLTGLTTQHGCTLRRISKYCTALEQSQALLLSRRITTYQAEFGFGSN
jgi:hypothetical protein